jgi:uncharacterized membrane protein (UPF0127 family)
MKYITVKNTGKAVTIGTRIVLANTFSSRLFGLLGKRSLDAGCGVLIRPSSGVHTLGMLFAIDVIALNKDFRVLKVWHRLAPFRVTSVSLKTNCILELAAGEIERCRIEFGDQLEITDTP